MSLRRTILVYLLIGLILPATLIAFFKNFQAYSQSQALLRADLDRTLDFLTYGTQEFLWNFDKEGAQPLLTSAMNDTRVIGVSVNQPDGSLFLSVQDSKRRMGQAVEGRRSVVRKGLLLGEIVVEMDQTRNFNALVVQQSIDLGSLLAQSVLSLFLILQLLNQRFVMPLKLLETQSGKLALHVLDDPFVWNRGDELGRLGRSLEATRQSLQKMFGELAQKNLEMEEDLRARIKVERELLVYKNHLEELVANRTQELVASNKELESFSYSVSHDLRAPLRSIDGFSRALLEDYDALLDEKGKDFLRRILVGVKRMSELIDDLLNLSQVTRRPLAVSDLDLRVVAEDLIQELRERDGRRSVEFGTEGDFQVRGDPNLLKIALGNLLENAWKYTSKVDDARIRFFETRNEGSRRFTVEDNGAGFSMSAAEDLFKPFHRLHRQSDYPGNGIGLALVQRIIERHGGKVWVQAEKGLGAAFSFTLGRSEEVQ